MDPDQIRRLWGSAGHPPIGGPPGRGLLGCAVVDRPEALVGAAFAALGLPAGGAAEAPAAVRAASSRYADWAVAGFGGPPRCVDYGDVAVVGGDLTETFVRAHERLADIVAAGATPLVLGGDAVVSLPVLQVLSGKLKGRLGVVAFSPSYDVAFEPVHAAATRWARALEMGVVAPSNLVLVGGRAAPPDARAREVLDRLGATSYGICDVARDGMATVAQEALEVAAAGTEAVYLSVDLAVLAGVTEPVGLSARELVCGVATAATALLAAADICGAGAEKGGAAVSVGVAARVAAEIVAGMSNAG